MGRRHDLGQDGFFHLTQSPEGANNGFAKGFLLAALPAAGEVSHLFFKGVLGYTTASTYLLTG